MMNGKKNYKKMKTKIKELPSWFNGELYDEGDIVRNPFTNVSVELNAEELSMYDFIKGAEWVINQDFSANSENTRKVMKEFDKGLRWFRSSNSKAYMVLLD